MSYSYPTMDAAAAATIGVTTVDCQKQVRSWRLLRSLIELLIPTCNRTLLKQHEIEKEHNKKKKNNLHDFYYYPKPVSHIPSTTTTTTTSTSTSTSTTITGTIFGYRHGKVNFCIQTSLKSTPILLLELAIPTTILAKEMQGGILRIALESYTFGKYSDKYSRSLLSTPVWTMYCNEKKVGFAIRRQPTKADAKVLRLMGSIEAGAGIINTSNGGKDNPKLNSPDGELMYLRAKFDRVCGSFDSESFHLIDPEGNIGQELSIFFHRSR